MKRKTKLVLWGICAFWSLVFLGLHFYTLWSGKLDFATSLEFSLRNWNVREGKPARFDARFVFLGIDDATINVQDHVWDAEEIKAHPALGILAERPGSHPRREFYAHVIERLCEAGAKAVIFDLVFTGSMPGDEVLRKVIEKYKDRVVLGANWGWAEAHLRTGAQQHQITLPPESIVPAELVPQCIGFVNYFTDTDGVVRSLVPQMGMADDLHFQVEDKYDRFNSLARQSLLKAVPELQQPTGNSPVLFRFVGPPGAIPVVSLYQIFIPDLWTSNFASGERFRDKIVLVGPASPSMHDYHRTPFAREMLGPELHLNVLNALLRQQFLALPVGRWDFLLIPLAGLVAAMLNFFIRHPVIRFIMALLVAFLLIAVTRIAYDYLNLYLIGAIPALCLMLSNTTCLAYEIVTERMEKARFRSTLELYVSKNVAHEIMRDEESFKNALGGARKPVTILFSDIRGFTSMTESRDEQELVGQLNEYFERMVDHCVLKHEGTLQKFIGDAIMAVWGDTHSDGAREDACKAVRAALDMRRELPELNQRWEKEGKPQLKIGIGVNHGTVVVGNIGSQQRREFTVIGDAVNLAARLESSTKQFKTDILIGEETFELIKEHFVLRTAGRFTFVGKSKAVNVYEPVAEVNDPAPRFAPESVAAFEKAVAAYYNAEFKAAIAGFKEFLEKYPGDSLAERFRAASADFLERPPEPGWDGIERMTSK